MKRRSRAFTLIEVLVAGGVSLLLGLTIFNVFVQSKRSLSHAIGTADLVQTTRVPLDRIGGYISTAASVRSQDPVLFPPAGPGGQNERGQTVLLDDPSTWYRYIVFRTTEDFLNPTYNPEEIMEMRVTMTTTGHRELMDAYENDAQRIFDYILWFEDDTNGLDILPNEDKVLAVARVEALTEAGPGVGGVVTRFRDFDWSSIPNGGSPFDDLEQNFGFEPRVIARRIEDVSFLRDGAIGLDINMLAKTKVRTAANGMQDKLYRATQRIHLPTEAMR